MQSFGEYKHIPNELPHGCDVVQVNIVSVQRVILHEILIPGLKQLQRHGARYPTSDSWSSIASAVGKIKDASSLHPQAAAHSPLAFVSKYNFTLGTDSLVDFGRLQ